MRQHFYTPDLRPSLAEDPGPSFEVESFGGRHPVTKQAKVREARRTILHDTESSFDDTFQLALTRLREGNNGPHFQRGVPTNSQTSSTNYPDNNVRIIDGEHKSLTSIGRINEAMDDDDHGEHIMKHRLELANPELNEAQRGALMEHISDHSKKHRKKLKAVNEAKEKFKKGLGVMSRPAPATQYDVIPQDSKVDLERKRTAGNIAMETRMAGFDRAVSRSYGGGSRRGL